MSELAFIVEKGSKVYKDYFTQKAEQTLFQKKAKEFFDNHFGNSPRKYRMAKQLTCSLSEEEQAAYTSQLKQDSAGKELKSFLARSPMNKAWKREVYDCVSDDKLSANEFWWINLSSSLGCAGRMSFSLWDNGNGELYGYFGCQYGIKEINLPDGYRQIKLSEYYAEKERLDALSHPEK